MFMFFRFIFFVEDYFDVDNFELIIKFFGEIYFVK